MIRRLFLLNLICAYLLSGTAAFAQSYQFNRLQKAFGENSLSAAALNNYGQIAGQVYSTNEDGTYITNARLAIWNRYGRLSRTGPVNSGQHVIVRAMNGTAHIAGEIWPNGQNAVAFLDTGAYAPVLLTAELGPGASYAVGMNDYDQVIGYKEIAGADGESQNAAFLYVPGRGSRFVFGSVGRAINNRGEVLVIKDNKIFLFNALSNSTPVELPSYGADYVYPVDLNEVGDALYTLFYYNKGMYFNRTIVRKASGSIITLPNLIGQTSTSGNSINDVGEVVGNACGAGEEGDEICEPFLFSRGRMIAGRWLVGTSYRAGQYFTAINNRGEILGHDYEPVSNTSGGFLLVKTTQQSGGTLGPLQTTVE